MQSCTISLVQATLSNLSTSRTFSSAEERGKKTFPCTWHQFGWPARSSLFFINIP